MGNVALLWSRVHLTNILWPACIHVLVHDWRIEVVENLAAVKMETFPTRQWSCSALMRGSSFLAEQITANKKMSYDEIVGVSRLMFLYACMDSSSHAWLPLQCFMCDFKLTKYDHILSNYIPYIFWCPNPAKARLEKLNWANQLQSSPAETPKSSFEKVAEKARHSWLLEFKLAYQIIICL